MSDPKHKRFSGFQILFHWVVAVPYLVLLSTGGLLILRRLGFLNSIPGTALSAVHRWVGIILIFLLVQLFIMAIAGGQIGSILRDLADWCRFKARDLLWMLMVPLNVLFPRRFHLPPVGRYNAGQKLHGVFIVLGLSTFAATGLWILLRPADIRPWIIHSWLFIGALAFLMIHLFLGLINPPTRRALPGIFKGHIPLEYVQEHHPLVLGPNPQPQRPHAVISLIALMLTSLVVVSGACGLVWYYGPQRSKQAISKLAGLEHPMISPGPLAKSHADDPRTATCEVCHESLKPPSSSACLRCHSEIAVVMQQKTGVHGQLQGECRTCHADHRGPDADLRGLNTVGFNHEQARFHLDGKHKTLQCDQCHVEHSGKPGERRFIGLQFGSCSDCHLSPHEQIAALDCKKCHTEQGWAGRDLVFDHRRDTNFPLDGRHAIVECAGCHSPSRAISSLVSSLTSSQARTAMRSIKPVPESEDTNPGTLKFRLTGVGAACADCHVDPHQTSMGADCQKCHTTSGWTGEQLSFNHDRNSSFALIGAHAKLECVKCHKLPESGDTLAQADFPSTPRDCRQCHQDPHSGQFGAQGCESCHAEQGWKGKFLLFDHNRDASFKIDAIHRKTECISCHPASAGVTSFRTLPSSCEQCHLPISQAMAGAFKTKALAASPHNGRVRCTDCHAPDRGLPTAQDFAQACAKCHNPSYRDLFFEWQKSLDERVASAQTVINSLKETDPNRSDALAARISEARRTGLHNISAATAILDEISGGQTPAPNQNGH